MSNQKEQNPETLRGKKIAVLKGGPGSEREVSLRSGEAVAKALQGIGCLVAEVDIPGADFKIPDGTDLAFIMLHGTFGEDGQLQALLEARAIPYTGEGVKQSETAIDKIRSKRCFDAAKVPTAKWEVIREGERPTIPVPLVLKAAKEGSSVGIYIVKEASQLDAAVQECFRYGTEVLVEEFIQGKELTIGILGEMTLPIIEIVPKTGFYDYSNKYTKGNTDYLVPAPLDEETTRKVQDAALKAYRSLGLEVYGRVDVLLNERGEFYVLEINTIPGMTETSLFPKAAAAVGIGFPELCERIGVLSLQRCNKKK